MRALLVQCLKGFQYPIRAFPACQLATPTPYRVCKPAKKRESSLVPAFSKKDLNLHISKYTLE